MHYLLKKIYYLFIKKKREIFMQELIQAGLQLGKNVGVMHGCFLDPPHCFLISIGDNTTLAPNVRLIAHDASTKKSMGYTKIGRIQIGCDCFIGDSSIILPNVHIGDGTVIGAGSVVAKDIPANSIAAGNPCREIMPASEYFQKCKREIADRKAPYAETQHNNLTKHQKQDVLAFLSEGIGYIR